MKSNLFFKRAMAYLIDFMVITLISSSLVYLSFINPKYEEYQKVSKEYSNYTEQYYNKELNAMEFSNKVYDLSYNMNKTGYVYVIADIIIIFLYFGVFAYFTKGQTLGKKLMGIKIVRSQEDKEMKLYNYFIRAFILNGIILKLFTLVAVCFSRSTYYNIYKVGNNIDTILSIIIVLMILFYKEGRGLHDLIAGTKVIDVKEVKEETEVIKPKKDKKEEK